jgi:hypothetical protein
MTRENDSLLELWRPGSWLGERPYEIFLSGDEPCEHGFVSTDPDTPGCECWERRGS